MNEDAGIWQVARLDQICISGGVVRGPFGGSLRKSDFVQSGYQVYEQRHAIGATVRGARYFVTPKKYSEMKRFAIASGDFLVSCSGTIGRIFQVPVNAPPGIINQALLKLTLDETAIDPQFFLQYFRCDRFQDQILDNTQGGAMKNLVGMPIFKSTAIPLPPLSEQRSISAALNDADELIATLERVIAKKQEIKQGMMQQLLTGKIRLPGFTKPWVEGTFEQLASPSRERAMPRDVPPATPLVDLDQIEGASGRLVGSSQASDAVSLKAAFKPGDVLFGKLRAYLRKYWYADVAGLCTTEIWVLRAKSGVHGRFVRYIVETDHFIEVASGAYGTHMPRSDWGTVRSIPVGIPRHDEQVEIASALAAADAEIIALHARLLKARDMKQGMMQQLLTGRIRLPIAEAMA